MTTLCCCANCSFFKNRKFKQKDTKDPSKTNDVTCNEIGIKEDGKPCKSFILISDVKLTEKVTSIRESLKPLTDDELNFIKILVDDQASARAASARSIYNVDDPVFIIFDGQMHTAKVTEIKSNGYLVLNIPQGENKLVLTVPPGKVCPVPVQK